MIEAFNAQGIKIDESLLPKPGGIIKQTVDIRPQGARYNLRYSIVMGSAQPYMSWNWANQYIPIPFPCRLKTMATFANVTLGAGPSYAPIVQDNMFTTIQGYNVSGGAVDSGGFDPATGLVPATVTNSSFMYFRQYDNYKNLEPLSLLYAEAFVSGSTVVPTTAFAIGDVLIAQLILVFERIENLSLAK